MTELQPGFASVFFEVQFDKLASTDLRNAVSADCTSCIDGLVSSTQREAWLNLPYAGDGGPESVLSFLTSLLATVNSSLVPVPSPKRDFYCWRGGIRICYTTQAILSGGKPVALTIDGGGQRIICEIILVMATVPTV